MDNLKFKKGLEKNLPQNLEKDTFYISTDTKKLRLNDIVWEDSETLRKYFGDNLEDINIQLNEIRDNVAEDSEVVAAALTEINNRIVETNNTTDSLNDDVQTLSNNVSSIESSANTLNSKIEELSNNQINPSDVYKSQLSGKLNLSDISAIQNAQSKLVENEIAIYLITDTNGSIPSQQSCYELSSDIIKQLTLKSPDTVTNVALSLILAAYNPPSIGVNVGDLIALSCVQVSVDDVEKALNIELPLSGLVKLYQYRIFSTNDAKQSGFNGVTNGVMGLMSPWDKEQVNKISSIQSDVNDAMWTARDAKNNMPTYSESNMNNALKTGVYPWCNLGRPAMGGDSHFTLVVERSTTADNNGYTTITQTAYGRENTNLGKIYKRILFEKDGQVDWNHPNKDWICETEYTVDYNNFANLTVQQLDILCENTYTFVINRGSTILKTSFNKVRISSADADAYICLFENPEDNFIHAWKYTYPGLVYKQYHNAYYIGVDSSYNENSLYHIKNDFRLGYEGGYDDGLLKLLQSNVFGQYFNQVELIIYPNYFYINSTPTCAFKNYIGIPISNIHSIIVYLNGYQSVGNIVQCSDKTFIVADNNIGRITICIVNINNNSCLIMPWAKSLDENFPTVVKQGEFPELPFMSLLDEENGEEKLIQYLSYHYPALGLPLTYNDIPLYEALDSITESQEYKLFSEDTVSRHVIRFSSNIDNINGFITSSNIEVYFGISNIYDVMLNYINGLNDVIFIYENSYVNRCTIDNARTTSDSSLTFDVVVKQSYSLSTSEPHSYPSQYFRITCDIDNNMTVYKYPQSVNNE